MDLVGGWINFSSVKLAHNFYISRLHMCFQAIYQNAASLRDLKVTRKGKKRETSLFQEFS